MACQAQLVNVIAPIMTEPGGVAWRQTIFHPFALTSRLAQGVVLRVEPQTATYETQRFGAVPILDAVATYHPATGVVAVFAVNRSVDGPVELTVGLAGFGELFVDEAWTVGGADPYARNSADDPDRVRPEELQGATLAHSTLTATLPPVSWAVIHLRPSGAQGEVDAGR